MHFSTVVALPALFAAAAVAAPVLESRQGRGRVTGSTGLSFYEADFSQGTNGNSDPSAYQCFSGPASNFPAMSQWISFEKMFPLLKTAALTPIGDSASEVQDIYNSIVKISKASKVDARVILAVIIQESTGNVRVGCTNNGVENCGLMQSHGGNGFNAAHPAVSIHNMIRNGVQGTPAPTNGAGLVQLFNDASNAGATTNGNMWEVLRAYNSGSIDASNLSKGMGATPSYVSDVANFLLGWQGWGHNSQTANCGFTE